MSEHHKGKGTNKTVTFLNTLQKVTNYSCEGVFGKCNSLFQVPLENTYPTLRCAGWTLAINKDSSVLALSYIAAEPFLEAPAQSSHQTAN